MRRSWAIAYFSGTLDAALVALDARTGRLLWETQVADTLKGYTITAAPLAIKDKIVVGVAGGEFGIRGFIDAYDAATGKRLWRFYTIPGAGRVSATIPGQMGDSWKQGSGATWLTGSYDADLDVLYWTVGNPGPDLNGKDRTGDNPVHLFCCGPRPRLRVRANGTISSLHTTRMTGMRTRT